MLYITYSNDDKTKGQEQWHVGDHANPNPWFKAIEPSKVIEIQADGHELDVIKQICKDSIPFAYKRSGMAMKRVQNWYGDHAKFIFANAVLGFEYT